jgi:hypothetical protein
MGGAPAEKLNEKAKVLERPERSKGREAPGLQSKILHLYIQTHIKHITHTSRGFGWRIHCGVEVAELRPINNISLATTSEKKKRLHHRVRKKMNTNTPNSDRTTP